MVNVKMDIPDEIFQKYLKDLTPQKRTMKVVILLERHGNDVRM